LRDVLRKVLIFLGLTVLLVGLILLGVGSVRSVDLKEVTSSTKSWEVSGNLTSGPTYVMDIFSSTEWQKDYTGGGYTDAQPIQVVITSPGGGETDLLAFFYGMQAPSGTTALATVPKIVQVDYGSVDSSLIVDRSYPQVRFSVRSGGNYTARIIHQVSQDVPEGFTNWTVGPPREMVFEEEVIENPSFYTSLIQSSGVVCLCTGAAVSVWTAKAGKGRRVKRKLIARTR
jgi:hypothetical protein